MLRVLRVVRVVRFARLLRMVRTFKFFIRVARLGRLTRMESALAVYISFMLMFYFYASFGIFNFEHGLNPTIKSFGDALWLGFTSLTTIGYGDIYPVTAGGRIMTALLAITGIGLFSLLTGEIAVLFIRPGAKRDR
jgi:voltage-gated potassium channel